MISTKLKQSKNRIFLLEITINLLLFSALLIVGLLFFIKTHKLTEETQVLHEAVNACSNAASAYEQEHGDLNAVSSLFNGSSMQMKSYSFILTKAIIHVIRMMPHTRLL